MSEAGSKILRGLEQAVAIAKGDQPAAAIWHNGHRYVPEASLAAVRADATREMVEALEEIAGQDIVELNLDPDWPRRIARAALEKARS